MAQVKFGALVTDMSGKLGGHVFNTGLIPNTISTKSRKGNKLALAVQKQSIQSIQNLNKINTQSWQALTDAQRSAWGANSANFPQKNRVGTTFTRSGFAHYMSINGILTNADIAPLIAPAAGVTMPNLHAVTITTATTAALAFGVSQHPNVGFTASVDFTRSMSAGRKPFDKDYVRVALVDVHPAGVFDVYSEYVSVFGAPLVGGYLNMRVYLICITTGQVTPPYYSKLIVS